MLTKQNYRYGGSKMWPTPRRVILLRWQALQCHHHFPSVLTGVPTSLFERPVHQPKLPVGYGIAIWLEPELISVSAGAIPASSFAGKLQHLPLRAIPSKRFLTKREDIISPFRNCRGPHRCFLYRHTANTSALSLITPVFTLVLLYCAWPRQGKIRGCMLSPRARVYRARQISLCVSSSVSITFDAAKPAIEQNNDRYQLFIYMI